METNLTIIAKVVASKFKASSMTKRDIVLKTELSANTVTNALNGKNTTINTLFRIIDALGMSLEDVVLEAKVMGLKFPKPSAKVQSVDIKKVTDLINKGETTLQIASRLGIDEDDLIEMMKDTVSTSKVKEEVEIIEVS